MKTTPACFLLVTPPENLPVNNGAKDSTAALQSRAPTAPGRCPHPTTSSNASSRLSPPLQGLLHRPVSSPTYSEPAVPPRPNTKWQPGLPDCSSASKLTSPASPQNPPGPVEVFLLLRFQLTCTHTHRVKCLYPVSSSAFNSSFFHLHFKG